MNIEFIFYKYMKGVDRMFSLKLARIKKNLTQKQLAELVGVSSSTINRIETGKQVLKLDMLSKLAEVLEIQVNELLESN